MYKKINTRKFITLFTMAKKKIVKAHVVMADEEGKPHMNKKEKPVAVALFNRMPEELQNTITNLAKTYYDAKAMAKRILELGQENDFTVDELSVVVKMKMIQLGMSYTPILKQLGELKKAETKGEGIEKEEAEKEAAAQVEEDVKFVDLNFDEVDRDEIIEGIKNHKRARIYFTKDDFEFVKIEFIKK